MNEARFEQILPVTGPVILDVSVNDGSIRILRGDPGAVLVRGILRAHASIFSWTHPADRVERLAANPPVEQHGNSIQIGDGTDRWMLRDVAMLVEILAPADTRVRALGDSADLQIEGLDGPVDCKTDSGEILIGSIGSQVSASTDSGAIGIHRVSGPVEARSDSGSIDAFEVGGRIEVKTDSGAIRLSQSIVAPVYAESDSGAIHLKLAADGGYTIRVRTDNGRVQIPQTAGTRADGREMQGLIRGGGSLVDLETDTGSIEVI